MQLYISLTWPIILQTQDIVTMYTSDAYSMFKNLIGSLIQTDRYVMLKIDLTSQSNLVKTKVHMGNLMLNIL